MKSATYVSTEGRLQMTRAAVPPLGAAREDWKILRALSEVAGATLPYDDVHAVRDHLRDIAPSFANYNVVEPSSIGVDSLGLSTLKSSVVGEDTTDSCYRGLLQDRLCDSCVIYHGEVFSGISRGTHQPDESEFRIEASAAA